jgi:hypothetical protein
VIGEKKHIMIAQNSIFWTEEGFKRFNLGKKIAFIKVI